MKIKLLIFSLLLSVVGWGQTNLAGGTTYNQNFDGLGSSSAAWTDNSTLPGWYISTATLPISTGTTASGTCVNVGINATNPLTDRAIGCLQSGGTAQRFGLRLRNNGTSDIASYNVSFTGEQWRSFNAGTLIFEYQIGATVTSLTAGSWTAAAAFNFAALKTSGGAAIDGNDPTNRTAISGTLTVLVPAGNEIFFRWTRNTNSSPILAVDDFSVTANSAITTGTVNPLSYCAGAAVSVPYTINGTFNPGNIFTAQLSNAAGSFAAPTAIGTNTSTAAGTINAIIPVGATTGSGYRIRVVSDNPVRTGTNNGSDITINALATPTVNISVTTGSNPTCAGVLVTFTATPSNLGGSTPTYQWQINGVDVPLETGITFSSTTLNNTDNVTCVMTVTGGVCLTTTTGSSSVLMTVNPCSNTLTTTAAAFGPFCNATTNTIILPYTQSGSFSGHSDIQISNNAGVFPSDATSQLLTYVSDDGAQVTADIPVSYAGGVGYRVRVVNNSGPTYFASGNNGSNIVIYAQPTVAAIGGGAANACEGASTPAFTNATAGGTWSIVNGTGSASVNAGGVVTGITAGTVTVVYTVTNGTCTNSASIGLTVNTVPADPTGSITVSANPSCGPATLSYTTGYYWQTASNGTSIANPTSSDYTLNATGTIYVRAFNGSCWSANTIDTGLITINTAPAIGTQPTAQIVTAPTAATFTVAATGQD